MMLVSKKLPKRKSYTVEFKLTTLGHVDRHESVSATAEEFGVDRKQIRMWRANRDVLLQHETGREKRKLKLHPGRTEVGGVGGEIFLSFYKKKEAKGELLEIKTCRDRGGSEPSRL